MTATAPPVPPHDPQSAVALASMGEFPMPPELTIVELLKLGLDAPRPTDEEIAGDAYRVSEHLAKSIDGLAEVPVLVCIPLDTTGPLPTLVWIHGGGMVSGSHRDGLPEVLSLARAVGAAVVSIGYRLAPEHPHPAPVDDCFEGLGWLADHAAEFEIDPRRIVLTGGSAGGGLAAAVALLARDRRGPVLAGQMLMYPMLDDRSDSPSTIQLAEWATWNRVANEAGWDALLGDARGTRNVSPYAAPARATDLTRLPPTFLEVGSTDLFRSETIAYAEAIWLAGGVAELHVWPGGFHGYEVLAPDSGIARGTIAAREAWLRRLLLEAAPR